MNEPLINTLKPCPFCGSARIEKFELPAQSSPTGQPAYTRNCHDCGGSTGGFATSEEAEEAWNQRVGAN